MNPKTSLSGGRARALRFAAAALVPLAAIAAQAPAPAGRDLLVRCKTLVVAPDTVVSPGELLLRDGKVVHVGREIPAETRARAKAVAFADATIVPGFVLAHSTLGRDRDLLERTAPLTPDLRAADAFDPFQDELLALPRSAVTSCGLAPSSANVAGGFAALVLPGATMGRIGSETCYAKFSLSAQARSQDRAPTSLMGAIDLLRQALLAAKSGNAAPEAAVLGGVLRGERRAFVQADTRAEILAALGIAREFGFEPVLVGAGDACKVVDAIAQARASLALAPLHPGMRDEELQLPQQLEARGVPFCFVGDAESLRASAALAVRHGCSRKVALAALTRTAAELVGVADAVGALRRGCNADFAVFGGDPLDLTSPLLAVYLGGEQVLGAPPAATTAAAPDLALKEAL